MATAVTTVVNAATDHSTGNVRSLKETDRGLGSAAVIGALTGGMGWFLKGVTIFANPYADMAIKEIIESTVATKAGITLRTLGSTGMPPGERLAYIYDWRTIAIDFGLGTVAGIAVGGTGIAFRGAAGEAVEQAAREGVGDALGDTADEGLEQAFKEGCGNPINSVDIRYRNGNPVNPIEITYEMRLNPELYIQEVVNKYGINLKGSGQRINVIFDPDYVKGPGYVSELYPNTIILGPKALVSESELANTIAHELNHWRSWLKGGAAPEPPAYEAGDSLADYINGGR